MAATDRIDVHQHLIPDPLPPGARGARPHGRRVAHAGLGPGRRARHDGPARDRHRVCCRSARPASTSGTTRPPGTWPVRVNEEHAELVGKHPDRFGQFAVLTLPDVEGAVAEAIHALDVLGADGVVVLSNAGGTYLGDPSIDPLWHALDERGAVVFVHPTAPPGLPMLPGLPSPLLDFPFDTTRAALQMATHRVPARHPDAGDPVARRWLRALRREPARGGRDVHRRRLRGRHPRRAAQLLRRHRALGHADRAAVDHRVLPAGARPLRQRLPLRARGVGHHLRPQLDEAAGEGHPVLDGVDRRNAEALLPRLRTP